MAVLPGSAARRGFWAAIAAAGLLLADGYAEPLPAALSAGFFLLVAWGIWKRRPGAALAGACLLLLAVGAAAWKLAQPGGGAAEKAIVLAAAAVVLLAVWLLLRAARELMPGARLAAAWPWAAVVLLPAAALAMWRPYHVPTAGMAETLQPGDRVLIEASWWRPARALRYGEIVAFHYPVDARQTFIQRIVGLPGDRLALRDGLLDRNREPVREPWAGPRTSMARDFRWEFPGPAPSLHLPAAGRRMLDEHVRDGELVVPEGRYFVMGDNRGKSLDSRYWGFITRADVVGRAVLIYGSEDSRRLLKRLP